MTQVLPLVSDALISVSARRRLTFQETAGIQTPGGKYGRQSIDLGMFVPPAFDRLYEPFGGGLNMTTHLIKQGWVTASQCHATETCLPLYDFHRVVQGDQCDALVRDLLALEAAHGRGDRKIFEQGLADIASGDAFRRARGFYIHNRMTQNGIREFDRPSLYSDIHTQQKGLRPQHILRLPLFGAVQAGMHLRCGDYRPLLREAARHAVGAFVFADPPYPVEDGKARYDETLYGAPFDHDAFVEEAKKVGQHALVMITLNDIPRNCEAFPGWNIVRRTTFYGASRRHGAELVIMNYSPPRQDDYMLRLGWSRVAPTMIAMPSAANDDGGDHRDEGAVTGGDGVAIHTGSAEDMGVLPDGSVHLVVTSPPYNVGVSYGSHGNDDRSADDYLAFIKRVFTEVYRVAADRGRVCVNIGNTGHGRYFPLSALYTQVLTDIGFTMRGEIIWNKVGAKALSTVWGSWRSPSAPAIREQHEHVLVFSKGEWKRPDLRGIAKTTKDEFKAATLSIWDIPAARRSEHPAPFPLELPRRLIKLLAGPNDVILDPFSGSGTTALAAQELGNRFVGFEIEPRWVEHARRRLAAEGRR